jgi:hypothetical protein
MGVDAQQAKRKQNQKCTSWNNIYDKDGEIQYQYWAKFMKPVSFNMSTYCKEKAVWTMKVLQAGTEQDHWRPKTRWLPRNTPSFLTARWRRAKCSDYMKPNKRLFYAFEWWVGRMSWIWSYFSVICLCGNDRSQWIGSLPFWALLFYPTISRDIKKCAKLGQLILHWRKFFHVNSNIRKQQ